MKTSMLLMVRYDGLAVIPVERVCEDYFQHLSADKFKDWRWLPIVGN